MRGTVTFAEPRDIGDVTGPLDSRRADTNALSQLVEPVSKQVYAAGYAVYLATSAAGDDQVKVPKPYAAPCPVL
eukprot:1017237-Amphidinium_carterae.1